MKKIEQVSAHPYKITLRQLERFDSWLEITPQKNHIQLCIYGKKVFYIGKDIAGCDLKNDMNSIHELSDFVGDVHNVLAADHKKRKIVLYDLLVDILESMGFVSPLAELEYELAHNFAHWIAEAKRYYHAAKILQTNYLETRDKYNKQVRKSLKCKIQFEEAFDTDKVIVYLYGRALECLLKSKIYNKFEIVTDYLTEHNQIKDKRMVKKWMENNIYIHDMKQLSVKAGCYPKNIEARRCYDQISELLVDGKYPASSKGKLYKGVANGQLEMGIQSAMKQTIEFDKTFTVKMIKKALFTEGLFDKWEKIVLDAVEKCYGKEFKEHFHEWNHPQRVRRMVRAGVSYKKEVRERNEMLRMIRKTGR